MNTKESTIQQTTLDNFTWVNVTAVTSFEISELQKQYGFEMDDLKRCLPPIQNPLVHSRPEYLFLIILLPIFDRETGLIHRTEVDFFITKDTIITLHDGGLFGLDSLFALCEENRLPSEIKTHNPAELAGEVMALLHRPATTAKDITPLIEDWLKIIPDINVGWIASEARNRTESLIKKFKN